MVDYEYYDWNNLIDEAQRTKMCNVVDMGIREIGRASCRERV